MGKIESFKNIVFAGGGSRCLWQAGFMDAIPKKVKDGIENIACVSAGALMACVAFSDLSVKALDHFKSVSKKNRKNFYPENFFRGKPLFPHYEMYKNGIFSIFEEGDIDLLKKKKIIFLLASPPSGIHPFVATMAGFFIYSLEKKIKYPLHPSWGKKSGFSPISVTIDQCGSVSDLARTVLQSSCTPPFLPKMERNGNPVLDGGLIDNVPAWLLDDCEGGTLVLLSRRYNDRPDIFQAYGRTYVQPSAEITVKRWDYTSPEGLQEAYDIGFQDGKSFPVYFS